jgi:hypothetical protein
MASSEARASASGLTYGLQAGTRSSSSECAKKQMPRRQVGPSLHSCSGTDGWNNTVGQAGRHLVECGCGVQDASREGVGAHGLASDVSAVLAVESRDTAPSTLLSCCLFGHSYQAAAGAPECGTVWGAASTQTRCEHRDTSRRECSCPSACGRAGRQGGRAQAQGVGISGALYRKPGALTCRHPSAVCHATRSVQQIAAYRCSAAACC